MMYSKELMAKVLARASDRFEVVVDQALAALAPENLTDISALKLRRLTSRSQTARTVLVGYITGDDKIKDVARWTAEVRDALLEPETSDLYLFLVADGLAHHACSRIESDEQFCRKYVVGDIAAFPAMLDRTFLCSLTTQLQASAISDPIVVAFEAAQEAFPWLEKSIQEQWLDAFVTNKAGKDLVTQIIDAEPPTLEN